MRAAEILDRLAGKFLLLWGWRRAMAAFLSGALSALALPPFFAVPVLFLTFPVLVWLIDSSLADPARGAFARLRRGFAVGWLFGFGYYLSGLWWVGHAFLVEADKFAWMLPFAVTLLPALLAIFWGLAAAFASLAWRDGWPRILLLAAWLSLAEYLRGTLLTGFPWNTLGYGAMPAPIAMQSASVLGLYGVTALALPIFCLAALRPLPGRAGGRGAGLFAVACMFLATAHLAYGAWRLGATPLEYRPGVMLRIVQPAIDQAEKWSPQMEERNFRTLLDLSGSAPLVPSGDGTRITHLVWPESAFPFVLTERRDALAALDRLLPDGTQLIAGALRVEHSAAGGRERVFNSVYVIDDNGEIIGAADKVHLVPFGEYLPFQVFAERLGLAQLTHLRGGFEAGVARTPLDAGSAGRFLALVCYEIIFAGESVPGGGQRPDFIVNVTNDAWFGPTPGPYQHLHQAVVRGVEEGLPIVRAANNGISAVYDGNGRRIARLGLGGRGFLDAPLPRPLPATPYANYGDRLFFAIVGLFLAVALMARRKG